MTWDATANEHVGHRCVLRDARTIECVDCSRKLILPRDVGGDTPIPTPFRAVDRPAGVPMPTGFKDRVIAEIRARRDMRTPPPEVTP